MIDEEYVNILDTDKQIAANQVEVQKPLRGHYTNWKYQLAICKHLLGIYYFLQGSYVYIGNTYVWHLFAFNLAFEAIFSCGLFGYLCLLFMKYITETCVLWHTL